MKPGNPIAHAGASRKREYGGCRRAAADEVNDFQPVAVGEAELTVRELVRRGGPEGVAGVIYRDEAGKAVRNRTA